MNSSKLKLIVNADDFGLAANINEGILSAHKNGIVTSTSIVAQGKAFKQAVEISKENPTLDVGIHLTLAEEFPLLNPERIPTLVNSEGKFFPHAQKFFKNYLLGKFSKDDIQLELEAQINKVINSGIKISHIDGHQHLHVLKDVFDITVKLALKYDIPVIRIPFEKIKPYMFSQKVSLTRILSLKVLNFISNKKRNKKFLYADGLAGFIFGGNLNKENLLKLLYELPKSGVYEIMCHPGYNDSASPYSHWNYNWDSELKALTDPDILKFMNERNIELINFRDFAELKSRTEITQ